MENTIQCEYELDCCELSDVSIQYFYLPVCQAKFRYEDRHTISEFGDVSYPVGNFYISRAIIGYFAADNGVSVSDYYRDRSVFQLLGKCILVAKH